MTLVTTPGSVIPRLPFTRIIEVAREEAIVSNGEDGAVFKFKASGCSNLVNRILNEVFEQNADASLRVMQADNVLAQMERFNIPHVSSRGNQFLLQDDVAPYLAAAAVLQKQVDERKKQFALVDAFIKAATSKGYTSVMEALAATPVKEAA